MSPSVTRAKVKGKENAVLTPFLAACAIGWTGGLFHFAAPDEIRPPFARGKAWKRDPIERRVSFRAAPAFSESFLGAVSSLRSERKQRSIPV